MKQQTFEQLYRPQWQQLRDELEAIERLGLKKAPRPADLPVRYRMLCQQLALARERQYSARLLAELNDLALLGHQVLYRRRTELGRRIASFLLYGFPRALRVQRGYLAVSSVLFVLPALLVYLAIYWSPELIYSVLDPAQVAQFESMYDPSSPHLGENRAASTDMGMFGYYIRNNIGVGFRTFASGITAGIGTAFFLVYNGLLLGAVAAHLGHLGFTEPFYTFVIGHGSFELTAIAIAGAAGLMLGHALIQPGRLSRVQALRRAAMQALPLVYGVIAMLVIAAFIEAFWSSNHAWPALTKYGVGAGLWLLVGLYLSFAGRQRAA